MQHRKSQTQTVAAAKAGISERSARRIDQQAHQPVKQERNWRTREDPLEEVWDSIVLPLLKSSSELTPVGIFDHLCEHHTDQFDPRARRTLERRFALPCPLVVSVSFWPAAIRTTEGAREWPDRCAFLSVFDEVCETFNWKCHACCLMGNHYHLLIETPEGKLSKGMRQLNGV